MSAALEAAIVRVRRDGMAVGAGFLTGPGKVLTCAHVVAEALGLAGTPDEAPSGEVDLDFPLLSERRVRRARVWPGCWVPIEPETGRGDIAGLDLVDATPADARPLRLVPEPNLFGHEFATFGFPAPPPRFAGDPLAEAGIWAHGRILGRQAVGHVQLEGTSDSGVRIEPGFSGSPIWDLQVRGAVGMTVTSDLLEERKTAYCIAASDLLAAWSGLHAAAPQKLDEGALVTFAGVDGPWAVWVAWWIERHGVPVVLHAVDGPQSAEPHQRLGVAPRITVALASPGFDGDALAGTARAGLLLALRIREGGEWPIGGASLAVDLVGRDRSQAEQALRGALLAAGLTAESTTTAAPPPAYPLELAGRRVEAGAAEHRERLIEQSDRRHTAGARHVAGRPPLDPSAYFKDRDRERARARELLTDPATRLVAVVGRGGIGKTAMACQVLGELEEEAEARGWDGRPLSALVYLSTRTGEITLERIFRECGSLLDEQARTRLQRTWANRELQVADKVDQLLDELGDSLLVVLLDNAEDLLAHDGQISDIDVASFVERTLARAERGARLLVTTREPIRLPPSLLRHDRRIALETGLPTPDGVALLRELDPDGAFGLADAPPDLLERAVERVHGVPRALEVLASIAATDFTSLQRVMEGFFGDERVVADLVEEAYKRLDSDSRLTLAALSVFTRPVPAAAVETLVLPIAPGLDVGRVLRTLARIHLVRIDRETGIVSLHPIDRDYARSLTPVSGPGSRRALEEAAADYWMRVRIPADCWRDVADIEPHLLEIEHSFNAGDLQRAAETLSLLDGHPIAFRWDARRLLGLRERLDGNLHDPRLQMLHVYGLGRIYSILGPTSRQRECIEAALARARELGDSRIEREALTRLGDVYRKLGDPEKAYRASEEAAGLHRAVDDRIGESRALSQMSLADAYRRRADEAYEVGVRALDVAGDHPSAAGLAHDTLTLACYLLGRLDEALEHSRQALTLYEEAHIPDGGAYVVNGQGLIYLRLGRLPEAIAALDRVRSWGAEIGSPRLTGLALFNLAHAYLAHSEPEAAEARARDAAEALETAGEPGGAQGARALAAAAAARLGGDVAAEADALAESARVVGWNPDLYAP
jgi:tetratricopeptide (TPR) repeat protein